VAGNGIDPVWDEAFVLDNVDLDSAVLGFRVQHVHSLGARDLAAYALPVAGLRMGLRWVPLWDAGGEFPATPVPLAGVLVEVRQR
jgi:hypothetical protein